MCQLVPPVMAKQSVSFCCASVLPNPTSRFRNRYPFLIESFDQRFHINSHFALCAHAPEPHGLFEYLQNLHVILVGLGFNTVSAWKNPTRLLY